MKTITVSVTAEDVAAAQGQAAIDAWSWPIRRALEGIVGEDVEVEYDEPCFATIGGRTSCALVVDMPPSVDEWLTERYTKQPNARLHEPFTFELELPDWLCALVESDQVAKLQRRLEFLEPLVEELLKPDGTHRLIGPNGYCPDCQGGCMRSITNPPMPYVEPSPFGDGAAR